MILVTGSTGRIGQDVAFGLVLADIQLRVLIHNGAGTEWAHWSNVETMMGDFAIPQTLDAALDGISAAFLISRPGPKQVELECAFIAACVRAGVEHVVKVSALGAAPDAPCRFLVRHHAIEQALLASGLRATILRPNQFMQNVLQARSTIAPPQNRLVANISPTTRISLVDTADVADIAVKKLFERAGASETLEVTGPVALTQLEVCAALSRRLNRTIAYEYLEPEAFAATMQSYALRGDVAAGIVELHEWQNGGAAEAVTDAVATYAGHPARTFDEFLKRSGKKLV
ncbi:MAG: NmrA family NAD(P)-binding protein [Candidatus Velthaea sp.]